MHICTVCERVFNDDELENAIQISGSYGRSRTPIAFRFPDGIHYLRKVGVKKPKQSPMPATEPKEDSELLKETVNTLAALPIPPVAELEVKPQVEPEINEEESISAMQFAWGIRRRK